MWRTAYAIDRLFVEQEDIRDARGDRRGLDNGKPCDTIRGDIEEQGYALDSTDGYP